jgi:hypothetical protein
MKFTQRGLLVAGAISGGIYVALAAAPYYRMWQTFSCAGDMDRLDGRAVCQHILRPTGHDRLIQNLVMLLSYVFMAIFVLIVVAFVSGGYWHKKQ